MIQEDTLSCWTLKFGKECKCLLFRLMLVIHEGLLNIYGLSLLCFFLDACFCLIKISMWSIDCAERSFVSIVWIRWRKKMFSPGQQHATMPVRGQDSLEKQPSPAAPLHCNCILLSPDPSIRHEQFLPKGRSCPSMAAVNQSLPT